MRRQPATIICDATRWRAPSRHPRAIGTRSPAITATMAVRPSMAASASSKTAAVRAPSISAASDPRIHRGPFAPAKLFAPAK